METAKDLPAEPTSLSPQKERTELRIAMVSDPYDEEKFDFLEVKNRADLFNSSQSEYYVEVIDYNSQGGDAGTQSGLQQLNIELTAGTYPDMICFTPQISPFPYISKGLLVDMEEYINEDPDISLEDIVAIKALRSLGGIFIIDAGIQIEGYCGLRSRFGDRQGWTLEEYEEIESSLEDGQFMVYNVPQKKFFNDLALRYARTAIDWENGACDFNNDNFLSIFSISSRVGEYLESPDNLLIGPPGTFLGNSTLVASRFCTLDVFELAWIEKGAGEEITPIGWPSVDGNSGCEINFGYPIGVVSKGEHIDGCWEFVKYLITEAPNSFGLSIYRPRLMQQIAEAQKNDKLPVQMTDKQAAALVNLADSVEQIGLFDSTVQSIIMQIGTEYFDGKINAQEAANIIQGKITIYLGELQ